MWSQNKNTFSQYSKENDLEKLPKGIYVLKYGPFGNMLLEKKQECFEFPYKIYGDDGFPERVVKAYKSINNNLGVMLCGIRGTGKTVQAEQICNLSGLPTILVTENFENGSDLVRFLEGVDQDVVVFIDEFDKLLGVKSEALLSAMDGALNGLYRRLFVFTANTLDIPFAMINRPSRLRYIKKFGNLKVEVICEVVNDLLQNKSLKDQVVEYLSSLEELTIDVVKVVTNEVNIFNEPPKAFRDVLNATLSTIGTKWDIFSSDGVLLSESSRLYVDPYLPSSVGDYLENAGEGNPLSLGVIESVDKKTWQVITNKGEFTVKPSKKLTIML